MHLLFWLSLIPFVTNWVGETNFAELPVAAYGTVLLLSGGAYSVLARVLVGLHGEQSALAVALGRDLKGWVSLLIYTVAIPLAFVDPRISGGLYALVAVLWLVPDRRIEKVIEVDRPQ